MSGISTSIHHVKNITATNEYLSGTVCHYTSIEVEQEDGNILRINKGVKKPVLRCTYKQRIEVLIVWKNAKEIYLSLI